MNNDLSQKIEALLFATAQAQSLKSLSDRLAVSPSEIKEALDILEISLANHSIMLVRDNEEVVLATKPEHSALIETIRKEELSKELSKASAETLSTIAYYPGISKIQIEFIRGVNASYSLRALSMRGLIESRGAGRTSGYYPTLQLLEHFGVAKVEELPNYAETQEKIKKLLTDEVVADLPAHAGQAGENNE
jgi:chromosome segregation and condensation protein ScpB